jgi:hypothetical protein
LEAFFSEDLYEVIGTLTNISYSGALIEDTSMQPEVRTPCVLYLYLKPPSAFEAVSPFRLTGHVVRHTSTGFAIEYEDTFDPDMRRMVDDAAAILTAERAEAEAAAQAERDAES